MGTNMSRTASRASVRVATHDDNTVAAIEAALDARIPIALLHPKLAAEQLAAQRSAIDGARLDPEDAVILFTSGSTGSARGVVLSHAAIDAAAAATWEHLGEQDDDVWACPLPLAHAGGLSIIVRCRARARARARARVTSTCTIAAGDTLASLVPAQLAELLDDPGWRPPRSLRAVLLGGAAAPRPLVDAALARDVPILQTYGMTESLGMVATAQTPGGPLIPLPGVTITAGTRDAPDVIGIRAPMLASRYLDDGSAITPQLVTRDLGFLDGGALHVVGRVDDMIITGGENVHPTAVEAVLAATPGVRAVAVFGVADAKWGQTVAAALVADAGFDEAGALAHWHRALPPFARPRRVTRIAALPRLPSGKVDRRALAALPTSAITYG
jgi:o-succinylbenzoate---CoA ligase